MDIAHRGCADVLVIKPAGRIDHANAAAFEQTVKPLLEPACAPAGIVFDLAGVDLITSPGLRVLIVAIKSLAHRHARLALARMTPTVADVIRIAGLDKMLDVFATVEDALAAFSPKALASYRATPGM